MELRLIFSQGQGPTDSVMAWSLEDNQQKEKHKKTLLNMPCFMADLSSKACFTRCNDWMANRGFSLCLLCAPAPVQIASGSQKLVHGSANNVKPAAPMPLLNSICRDSPSRNLLLGSTRAVDTPAALPKPMSWTPGCCAHAYTTLYNHLSKGRP